MKIACCAAVALCLCSAVSPALAGTTVSKKDAAAAKFEAAYHKFYDHPLARPLANPDVKVEVTADTIMRSCCSPPTLAIAGKVTNTSARPIDYVQLMITFRDEAGKPVYSEDCYNHRAISMGEDAEVAKILNETPHFDPLPPGTSDNFGFTIPMPLVPHYRSADLRAVQVFNAAKVAQAR